LRQVFLRLAKVSRPRRPSSLWAVTAPSAPVLHCPHAEKADLGHDPSVCQSRPVLGHFMATYGYLAVFVGTLFEGETILVLGGYAAHRGHLNLPVVMVVAFAGSLLGDQTMFWIGHRYGKRLVKRWPGLERRIARVRPLLDRFGNVFALIFRFFYGLRNGTPVAMAIGGFDPRRFVGLNALGAVVWAVGVSALGYVFGEAAEVVLPHTHRYQMAALVAIIFATIVYGIVRRATDARTQRAPRTW